MDTFPKFCWYICVVFLCVAGALFTSLDSYVFAEGRQGENWFTKIDRVGMTLEPESGRYLDIANVTPTEGREGKLDAMLFEFKKAGRVVMTNRKNPKILKSEDRQRRFILRYWVKTETDYRTGHNSACSIRMQTPSCVGSRVTYPRTKFRYLDEWTHVGMIFSLEKSGLVGNLQFRVESTMPGLRLWLDALFFTEVTDLPEDRVEKLLEDSMFEPIQQLPLREDLVDRSPPEKGNKVWNTGFEAVANGAWGYAGLRLTDKDFITQNPHGGQRALLLSKPLMHWPVPLTMYKKHTFSVWVRQHMPSVKSSIKLTMNSWGGEYSYSRTVNDVGSRWQRVSVSAVLMPDTSGRYWFEIRGNNVVIDDIQAEEGDATEYAPRGGVEAALSMDAKAYIYEWGQSVPLHVYFANTTCQDFSATATVRVWDIFENVVYSERIPLQLGPHGRLDKAINLPDTLRGAFCADILIGHMVLAERVFSVLPEPRDILAEQSMLGDHLNFTDFNLWAARRMGTRWTRCHDGWTKVFKMYRINPKPDKWSWKEPLGVSACADDAVDLAKKYEIKILGLLDEPPGWAVGLPDRGRARGFFPEDWDAWLKYVRTVVTRYKDYIDAWELYNEPSNASKYVELCRNTYPVFKEALPEGRLVGLSSTPNSGMTKEFRKLGGHEHLDAISAHLYGWSANGSLGAAFGKIYRKFQKDGEPMPQWMTEGNFGATQGTFFRAHPKYDKTRRDVKNISRYLTVARAHEIKRVFYYWSNYPSPKPQNPVQGNGWSFYHHDSSLTPGGVAWAVWAKMLDGTEPLTTVIARDEEIYLFVDGKQLVAVIWAQTPRNINLPAGVFSADANCTRFDVMGNAVDVDLNKPYGLSIGHYLYYFRFQNVKPEEVVDYLRAGIKLAPPLNPHIKDYKPATDCT